MSMPAIPATPGSWGAALQELGLDHPALMRLGSTRRLLEQGHRIYEQRRSLDVRLIEARAQVAALEKEHTSATAEGLLVLEAIQSEVANYTADLTGISNKLADRFAPIPEVALGETLSDESFVQRHHLREQYDAILDMFSSFGLYDARSRTVRFQGPNGRVEQVPTFETLVATVLTDEIRDYLATARGVGLLLTPAADARVFSAIGKTIGFNNYAGSNGASEGAEACADFVRRLRSESGNVPLTDDLLRSTPFEGLRVTLFAEDGGADDELRANGLPLDATVDDISMVASDAAARGVEARPLSPPEYLLLQTIRRRAGQAYLDAEITSSNRSETWFPQHELAGASGTLVARSVGTGIRFRAVELGRGVDGRGYRMAYAPLAQHPAPVPEPVAA